MGYGMTSEEVPKLMEQFKCNQDTQLDKALENMSLVVKCGHILKHSNGHIDKMQMLLDSQSTVSIICNKTNAMPRAPD